MTLSAWLSSHMNRQYPFPPNLLLCLASLSQHSDFRKIEMEKKNHASHSNCRVIPTKPPKICAPPTSLASSLATACFVLNALLMHQIVWNFPLTHHALFCLCFLLLFFLPECCSSLCESSWKEDWHGFIFWGHSHISLPPKSFTDHLFSLVMFVASSPGSHHSQYHSDMAFN